MTERNLKKSIESCLNTPEMAVVYVMCVMAVMGVMCVMAVMCVMGVMCVMAVMCIMGVMCVMMEGKVRAALRLIADGNSGGPLSLDSHVESNDPNITPATVRETLLKKHPPKQPLKQSALFISPNTQTVEPHPVLFDKIDGQLIRSIALKSDGAAGPSGLDAAAWKRLCSSF